MMTSSRNGEEMEGGTGRVPTPGMAILLLAGVMVTYLVGGVLLQMLLGEVGIALAQLLFFLLPALLLVRVASLDPARTFSLEPLPGGRALWGGILLLAGGVPLAWFLVWLQSFVLPLPVEMLETMAEFLTTDDPLRLLWLLVLVAAVPAVAEEFLFRGVVLSAFRSRYGKWGGILASGFAFGLVHLAPQTAFRFLPTFFLGALLAWVVVETRSIWMGVLLHFLNNGSILILSFLPMTRPLSSEVEQEPPLLLLPVAIGLFLVGVQFLRKKGGSVGERSGFSS